MSYDEIIEVGKKHLDDSTEKMKKMAEKLRIMVTYGSDCHGPKDNGPLMGKFGSKK